MMTDKEFQEKKQMVMARAETIDFVNMTPWSIYKLGLKHGVSLAIDD